MHVCKWILITVHLLLSGALSGCIQNPTVFGLPAYTQHFEDPEDAITPWLPVFTTVEAKYSAKDSLWFVIEKNHYYEGWDQKVRLFSSEGVLKYQSERFTGPFHYSRKYETLLLCEIDNYEGLSPAELFNIQGQRIREINPEEYGYTESCGASQDGEIFWIRYVTHLEANPNQTIVFYDFQGNKLSQHQQSTAQPVSFEHKGKQYRFEFNTPAPGP